MKKITGLLLLLWGIYPLVAQQVTKEFNRTLVEEDFGRIEKRWPQQFNADNLFISGEGTYDLWRKNSKSGFLVFPEQMKTYSVFEAVVTLEFNTKETKKPSGGLVLQAQEDGSGAIVVEINSKKQYRVRRAMKSGYVNITGTENGDGWVKAKKFFESGSNTLMVRTYDRIYDLYINGSFVTSFTEIEFSRGQIGLYIGASSKVQFDHLTIRSDDDNANPEMSEYGDGDAQKALSAAIIKLKESLNKKDKEIADLQDEIRRINSARVLDTMVLRQKNEAEIKVYELSRKVDALQRENDALKEKVAQLEAFRSEVKGSENGDVIINLTNLTQQLKKQNEQLDNNNKYLQQELAKSKEEFKSLQKDYAKQRLELDDKDAEILRLKQEIFAKDSVIRALRLGETGNIKIEEKDGADRKSDKKSKDNQEEDKREGDGKQAKKPKEKKVKEKKTKKEKDTSLFEEGIKNVTPPLGIAQ